MATARAGLDDTGQTVPFLLSLNGYRGDPPPSPADWLATRWRERYPDLVSLNDLLRTGRLLPLPADRPARRGKGHPDRDGKEVAGRRLAPRAQARASGHIRCRVALTDGAAPLQGQMQAHRPGFTPVLDIIQAAAHPWEAANAVLGERHPERTAWVRTNLTRLLSGQTDAVIAAVEVAAADPALTTTRQQAAQRTIGYYRRNAPFMRYDEDVARGWPIGTGVVEGACGHLVKDRME